MIIRNWFGKMWHVFYWALISVVLHDEWFCLGQEYLPLINKCCGNDRYYDFENDKCELKISEIGRENAAYALHDAVNLTRDFFFVNKRLILDLRGNYSEEIDHFRFRFGTHFPTCTNGTFLAQLNIAGIPTSQEGIDHDPEQLIPFANFTTNGQLRIRNEYYSTPEFCILGLTGNTLNVRVCNATCGGRTPCVRKCCDLNQVWNISRGGRQGCAPAGSHFWTPNLYSSPKVPLSPQEINLTHIHYKIVHPRELCQDDETIPTYWEHRDYMGRYFWKFRLGAHNEVFVRRSRYTWTRRTEPEDTYCVDGEINSNFWVGEDQSEFSGMQHDEFFLHCLPSQPPDGKRHKEHLYIAVMVVSCIFSLLTILVHFLLWDKLPNHTWTLTLITYSASFFCICLVLIIMRIVQAYVTRGPGQAVNPYCYAIGVGLNFFLVSTFCWMTAINYDIFRTFKKFKVVTGDGRSLKLYCIYSVLAWGVPTVIVTVAIVIDSIFENDFDSDIIVPAYGIRSCNLDPEYAQLVYNYGPGGILISLNLICFIITVCSIVRMRRSTKLATSSSTKNKEKQNLKLFAKLLFVMGFPWVFEVISWYTEREKASGNAWYWVIFDMVNILQSVIIFYVFVCKRDIINLLAQKYPSFKKLVDRIRSSRKTAQVIANRHPTLNRLVKSVSRKSIKNSSDKCNSAQMSSVPNSNTSHTLTTEAPAENGQSLTSSKNSVATIDTDLSSQNEGETDHNHPEEKHGNDDGGDAQV